MEASGYFCFKNNDLPKGLLRFLTAAPHKKTLLKG